MTSLFQQLENDEAMSSHDVFSSPFRPSDRRRHRRHDLEEQELTIDRWDGARKTAVPLGRIVDLSAGGVRIRTQARNLRPDGQIRIRMQLPVFAGIHPFVNMDGTEMKPRSEWVGWMSVSRVKPLDDQNCEVAGRLVDMDEVDRGMLGLYLSTQPLAA